eukprot:TRINITY_DN42911_c0_g1_i1.p1 TRINITY_DN42911_c0_g1~~TRINITY_DN42911_c0_g1_i1.p1  ORF type:complete len:243 (+),score=90.82 TRINITY_DN42911_c0_g1_i1:53-781(+)
MQLTPWVPLACASVTLSCVAVVRSKMNKAVDWVTGFCSLVPAAGIYCYYGSGAWEVKLVIMGMTSLYAARLFIVLTKWFSSTAAAKIGEVVDEASFAAMSVFLTNVFMWVYTLPFYWAADLEGMDYPQYIAVLVYCIGTIFHFGSDYQKHQYKQDPSHKGVLLQSGFWGLSRHPNYFGDFLIFLSYALLVPATWQAYFSPLVNILQYAFDAIPKSEKMAAQRYGDQWAEYRKNVACFVPFVI